MPTLAVFQPTLAVFQPTLAVFQPTLAVFQPTLAVFQLYRGGEYREAGGFLPYDSANSRK
jgi:hypothetical protein